MIFLTLYTVYDCATLISVTTFSILGYPSNVAPNCFGRAIIFHLLCGYSTIPSQRNLN